MAKTGQSHVTYGEKCGIFSNILPFISNLEAMRGYHQNRHLNFDNSNRLKFSKKAMHFPIYKLTYLKKITILKRLAYE